MDYDNIQIFGEISGADNEAPRLTVSSINQTPVRVVLSGTATDDSAVARVTVNGRTATGTNNWRSIQRLRRQKVITFRVSATDDEGAVSPTNVIRIRRPRS